MRMGRTFISLRDAETYSNAIDQTLGYPNLSTKTERYTYIIEKADNAFAVVLESDAPVDPLAVVLDNTWDNKPHREAK